MSPGPGALLVVLSVALFTHALVSSVGLARADGPTVQEAAINSKGGPWEITTDTQGNLWISDSGVDEVWQVNSETGAYTIFQNMTGVSDARRDAAGHVWWTDVGNNRLARLVPGSNTMTTWPLPGSGSPWGTAIDTTGRVWVTDSLEPQIHRFDSSTTELCTYVVPDEGVSDYILVRGVLNPTTASGATSTVASTTDEVAPSCSTLGAGTTTVASTSAGVASWTSDAMTLVADDDGWTAYRLSSDAAP
jgi:streptogramin lyase